MDAFSFNGSSTSALFEYSCQTVDINRGVRVDKPLVSIILPVFNGVNFMSKAIESCLSQTHCNIELIIVDDFSTDCSLDIAASYAACDCRVSIVRHSKNMKLPAALNSGFEVAKGELLTWTSHDNYHSENAIERLVDYLENNPDVGVVYSDFFTIDNNGDVTGEVQMPASDQLIYKNVVGASFLYRRKVFEKLGAYDESMFLAEDYDYWLRAYQYFDLSHLAEKLYFYRNHDLSLTRQQFSQVFFATEKVLNKFKRENTQLNTKIIANINYNLVRLSYVYELYDKSVKYFLQSLKTAPLFTLLQLLKNYQDVRMFITAIHKSKSV